MAVLTKTPWLLIFFVLLGGLLGGLLGEILRAIAPTGPLQDIFAKIQDIGLNPPFTIDLKLFTITFGFTLRVNLFSILGILLGIYIYKQA
ncbi:MAG TPA: DUF4321 domain-containing protein [Nitrospiria bacterium]|nr:DUF4321 domain-containing protein [Nitrospiria bacterium]